MCSLKSVNVRSVMMLTPPFGLRSTPLLTVHWFSRSRSTGRQPARLFASSRLIVPPQVGVLSRRSAGARTAVQS